MQNVIAVVNDGRLCKKIVQIAHQNNVTNLMTVRNIQNIGDVCQRTPLFSTIFVPGPFTQPSSMPSGQPTSMPTGHTPTKTVTVAFVGYITIVLLIAFFRFFPSVVDMYAKKDVMKKGHLYDILVILNSEEHAVLENIRHEDIAFFRRIETENDFQSTDWLMNVTSDVLQKRFEVEFFDTYDLLGQNKRAKADKTKTTSDDEVAVYVHEATICMGMIIKVIPSKDYKEKGSEKLNATVDDGSMEHCPDILSQIKPATHSKDVLIQLPHCYKTRTHHEDELNGLHDYRNRLPLISMSAPSVLDDGISDSSDDDVMPFHTNAPIFGEKPLQSNHFLKEFVSDSEGSVDSLSLDMYMNMNTNGDKTNRSNRANQGRLQSANSNASRRGNINLLKIHEKIAADKLVSKSPSFPFISLALKTSRIYIEQPSTMRSLASGISNSIARSVSQCESLDARINGEAVITQSVSEYGSLNRRVRGGVTTRSVSEYDENKKMRHRGGGAMTARSATQDGKWQRKERGGVTSRSVSQSGTSNRGERGGVDSRSVSQDDQLQRRERGGVTSRSVSQSVTSNRKERGGVTSRSVSQSGTSNRGERGGVTARSVSNSDSWQSRERGGVTARSVSNSDSWQSRERGGVTSRSVSQDEQLQSRERGGVTSRSVSRSGIPNRRERPSSQNGSWQMRERGEGHSRSLRTWTGRNKDRPQLQPRMKPQPISLVRKNIAPAWKEDKSNWGSSESDEKGIRNTNKPTSESDEDEYDESGQNSSNDDGEEKESDVSRDTSESEGVCEEEKDDESGNESEGDHHHHHHHISHHHNHNHRQSHSQHGRAKHNERHIMSEEKEGWL